MKKLVILTLTAVISIFFSVTVFGQDRIAIVLSSLNNPFFIAMKKGAEAKAHELGYDLIVLDSQNDQGKELANVEFLTVRGVEAILINPTDSNAVSNAIRMANRANIPVITLDRAANRGNIVSHIASNNLTGGEMAGKYIAERLGTNAQVIQLEGIPGTSVARERGQGFINAVDNYRLDLLASQTANFNRTEGYEVMIKMLTSHPNVQAVFSQNDEMALGALQAIHTSSKSVIIVGFDGSAAGINAINNGLLDATIAQQPVMIGALGIETAVKLLKGKEVDSYISVPLKIIIK